MLVLTQLGIDVHPVPTQYYVAWIDLYWSREHCAYFYNKDRNGKVNFYLTFVFANCDVVKQI